MILESLASFASREGLVAEPGYQLRKVHFRVALDQGGSRASLTRLAPPQGTAPSRAGIQLPIPRRSGRTSDDVAEFLVDNLEYVFGAGSRAQDKRQKRHALFVDRVRFAADATADPALVAICRFFESESTFDRLRSAVDQLHKQRQLGKAELFAFSLEGDDVPFIHLRPRVRSYWAAQVEGDGRARRCLISGARARVAEKHAMLKGVPGTLRVGASLVSFNIEAAESYGWRQAENAPISFAASEACTSALNALLAGLRGRRGAQPESTRQALALGRDAALLFWGDGPSAASLSKSLPEALERGELAALQSVHERQEHEPSNLFLLKLAGTGGRVSVRNFDRWPAERVRQSISRWLVDADPADGDPAGIPLRMLLDAITPGGFGKTTSSVVAYAVVRGILCGEPLPRIVLDRLLGATPQRSEIREARRARLAVLLAYHRRSPCLFELSSAKTGLVDLSQKDPAYLLGRLFACLERLRELAVGGPGVSMAESHFSAACANPRAVFPRLLVRGVHDFRIALRGKRGGTAVWLHREVGVISAALLGDVGTRAEGGPPRPTDGLPGHLSLEAQGLFALAYHQKRHECFQKRKSGEKA